MHHEVLIKLADGQRHTAGELMTQLALNPAELKQAISTLITYGVQIHFPAADEYQLSETLELLDYSHLNAALPAITRQHLALVEIHSVLDSTNRYALEQCEGVVPFACLAEYQTAGRGQQGRQWISPYASGLCLSLKHRFQSHNSLVGLNLALAVTVVQVLRRLGAVDVGLKWPNDILWKGRKLAGLLLESRCEKNSCEVVIGIGINVKMPAVDINSIIQPWVDLHTILGQPISRNVLAAMLIDHCLQTLIIYPQEGLALFLPDWYRFDLSYGQRVTLEIPFKTSKNSAEDVGEKSGNEFEIQVNKQWITGTACGIDEQGALLLQVGNHCRRYVYGEVRLHL